MQANLDLDKARFNMIEQQVRPWEVLDAHVLELLDTVHRDLFVPAGQQALAYVDMELPVGTGQGQVMLAPRVQARMVQELALQSTDKVLEVGTGTGFTAALMAQQAEQVLSLETDAQLAEQARANLARANIHNVQVRQADGSHGAAADGPFDAIMLSGSVPEVPQSLLDQLKVGGRLVAIVGQEPIMRATIITRVSDHSWSTQQPWDANAPRLTGFVEPTRFEF
jgi:protein-L-isoaspartate(D-aspartate) O-methyltransferase